MLSPNKNTDIKYSILYISGIIMKELQRSGTIKYDDLKNVIIETIGKEIGDTLELSLSFLFLLDKITYCQQTDCITL